MATNKKVFYWWVAKSLDSIQPPHWAGTVWMSGGGFTTRMFWTKKDLTEQEAAECDAYFICFGTFSEMITSRIAQRIDERSADGEFAQDFRKQTVEDEEEEEEEIELGQVALF